ncbi:hypothetical protein EZV62_026353 [Acer yangbiense]|uniref:Uncharacterized protein n=1 Tax=Acer yangbiense TaxID=1000413 RepID=A0A5C7GRD9_9ROSI|nr:hypothetical protein EZV62_026353 [Acer yangbiense]
MWWRRGGNETIENEAGFLDSKYLKLNNSLKDVCSFYDLKQRMRVYLSLTCCKEICDVMTQITKNIDGGRLRMKSHCPIVTDVGIKEKAIRDLEFSCVIIRLGFELGCYYEILGNIILKRFLLLDKAKSKSFLPLKYGIDGVDGGSPLLFLLQSSIKMSSQDAAMLPDATKDELQNVNFICAAIKCDMELLNAARKTLAMMFGGIMQKVNSG